MWPDMCLRKFTLLGEQLGDGGMGARPMKGCSSRLGEQERVYDLTVAMRTERMNGPETIRRKN